MKGVVTLLTVAFHSSTGDTSRFKAANHKTGGGDEILAFSTLLIALSMFAGAEHVISVKNPTCPPSLAHKIWPHKDPQQAAD